MSIASCIQSRNWRPVARFTTVDRYLGVRFSLSAPHCKVIRNGEHKVIELRELVVGDVVEIETGDSVPADLRLVESVNLKIQEAALTGESLPVEKDTSPIGEEVPIGDRTNMAFRSCSVLPSRMPLCVICHRSRRSVVLRLYVRIRRVRLRRTR